MFAGWQFIFVYLAVKAVAVSSQDFHPLDPGAVSCGKNFTTPSGHDSVNSSDPSICTWNIENSKTNHTFIQFTKFRLLKGDYVAIYDGDISNNSNLVANVTGMKDAFVVVAFSPSVTIEFFRTNKTKDEIVMAFNYNTTGCDMPFHGYAGRVTAPLYLPNRGEITCTYTISGMDVFSPNKIVSLAFTEFNIISGSVNITGGKKPAVYKGSTSASLPGDYFANGNTLHLSFVLNKYNQSQTFDAIFATVDKDCNQYVKVTDKPQNLTMSVEAGESPLIDCRWIVQTTVGQTLMAKIKDLELMVGTDADTVIMKDGASLGDRTIFQMDKMPSKDDMFLTSGYQMWLRFVVGNLPGIRRLSIEVQQAGKGGRVYDKGQITLPVSNDTASAVYYQLVSDAAEQVQLTVGGNGTFYPVGASLDVYDGLQEVASNFLVNFRDRTPFFPVTSSSSSMLVVARNFTDQQKFSAHFQSIDQSCDVVSSGMKGDYSLQLRAVPQKLCRWTVKPKNSQGTISFRVTKLQLGPNDTVLIYKGVQEFGVVIQKLDMTSQTTSPKISVPASSGVQLVYASTSNCTANCTLPVVSATFMASEQECGGLLKAPKGVISSPDYPNLYPLNAKCTWDATNSSSNVTSKQQLYVTFREFNLGQGHSVTIANTKLNATVKQLAQYGGTSQPKDIIVGAQGTGLTFTAAPMNTSGPQDVGRGFQAQYWKLDCGGNLTTSNATGGLTTPGYPKPVTKKMLCVWIIQLPLSAKNDTVHNAVQFKLNIKQADKNATNGVLSIHDGGSLWDPEIHVNTSDDKDIIARTNSILVVYNYTGSKESNAGGFSVQLNFSTFSCDSKEQCANGICIHPDWKCNGVDDCGDMTDEKNCAAKRGSGLVNSYWVPVCLILGLLFGIFLTFLIPAIYKRIKYPNYSQLRDMTAPVPT